LERAKKYLMQIQLSLTDGVPIYRQIVRQIKYAVAAGTVESNQELPPIRVLAERLSVTPNTIVKAYDQLEAEGIVYKRRGAGTYFSELQAPMARRQQLQILTDRVDDLLSEAKQLGFSVEEVIDLLQKRGSVVLKRSKT